MNSAEITTEQFRSACSKFPTGVTVTTVCGVNGEPYGITVSSFTSVSLNPPLVLVCIDQRSQMCTHLKVHEHFGINILGEQQRDLSVRFSKSWEHRFANVPWYPGPSGAPLLFEVAATLECRVVDIMPIGDHIVTVGLVLYAACSANEPLTYANRTYLTMTQL
jgi:flavin reductase (DIM6/NTAB) family NADH-FMN oxidoreductase RutF